MAFFDVLFGGAKRDVPSFIQKYQSLNFAYNKSDLIDDISFCVLDCETTGLEKASEIITIGAVTVNKGKIELKNILDQKYNVSRNRMAEIHGELNENDSKLGERELVTSLLEYIANKPIVGHHISFDISMINYKLRDYLPGFKLRNKTIDTFNMAKRIDPVTFERSVGSGGLQLDELCQKYGIEVENRHTALGDAFMTAQLFLHLLDKLRSRGIKYATEL